MTVQELINELEKIEDKSKLVTINEIDPEDMKTYTWNVKGIGANFDMKETIEIKYGV